MTLYRDRKLSQGHPAIEESALHVFEATLRSRAEEGPRVDKVLTYLRRLTDLDRLEAAVVLGCGPRPELVRALSSRGVRALGVEPLPAFARAAAEYLGDPSLILEGAAERMPLPDASHGLVFAESVLEHVESPERALAEMFRVLVPGGVVFLTTTNRYRLSLTGDNGEYRVPFFNWLPDTLKECYVFQHLHYAPGLAHYSARPAVHWFSHADLCRLGRQAGFTRFYSVIDLADRQDPSFARSRLKGWLLEKLQRRPWLRALALLQLGGAIFMMKRNDESRRDGREQVASAGASQVSPV